MKQCKPKEPLVLVVDDDDAVRESLSMLLDSVGISTFGLSNALESFAYLDKHRDEVACLILDIRMPGMSGIELQKKLIEEKLDIPIIFITGHGDVPMAVDAMKLGAIEFLQKPFKDQTLLDCVNKVLTQREKTLEDMKEVQAVQDKISQLTAREKEVMGLILDGKANKVIAFDLGVSQRTIEIHRANVMKKMGVRSVAELARIYYVSGPDIRAT